VGQTARLDARSPSSRPYAEIAASTAGHAVKRTLVVVLVAVLALSMAALLVVSARDERTGTERRTPRYALGVQAKPGDCVLVELYHVGGVGRPGPRTPHAAVRLVRPRENGLVARRVAPDIVVLERFESGRKIAAYETQLLEGFAPTAWMVTRAERSLPCGAARDAGPAPDVPPLDRPDERPSP
jgi:hypothetical protein